MSKHILITGGAGFIGSHLADELLERGHRVRVLDALIDEVHGHDADRPAHLDPEVEFRAGDILDPSAVREALKGIDAVYHLAAMVGAEQSMNQICDYTAVNNDGTAVLLEALARRPVERLVVASSMSVYGEGLYRSPDGVLIPGELRTAEQLKAGDWELRGRGGRVLVPVPTPETKTPALSSVYALSKYDQERLCLMVGQARGIPTVALRLFNVYGPRQALSNPYTGVLGAFVSRLFNGQAPVLFEDGKQRRDFVNVHDVVRACADALTATRAPGRVINVASGSPMSLYEIAQRVARVLGRPDIQPEIAQRHRVGDIRHCYADISLAREVLNFTPRATFEQGVQELAEWLERCVAGLHAEAVGEEPGKRGLTV